MREKMLVTQALDERDLLVKKISDKIDKASFVDTIKPNAVSYTHLASFEALILNLRLKWLLQAQMFQFV